MHFRIKNKGEKLTVKLPGFHSPQSFGKALNRANQKLPRSPSKRQAIVAGLAEHVGLELTQKMQSNIAGLTKRGLSDDVEKTVKDFYFRTDIVYTAPGMNDVMTFWQNGQKTKLRKYYLVMFLREVFELFKRSHPDISVGFSKFASMRPNNVLLLKEQPADQCRCQLHENFKLRLSPLKIIYDQSFWKTYLCNTDDLLSECWMGECVECSDGNKLLADVGPNDTNTAWKIWAKDANGRLKIELKQGCIGELKEEILESFSIVREHVRIKRMQAIEFESDKSDDKKHVLQCDFAMAYSCEYQNEIQSALWSRQSVNLFTAALYSNTLPCKSYLIVTDSQDKGKNAVFTFMNKLCDTMPHISNDETLVIFTDGPSSEFKNRFMVKLVAFLSNRLQCHVQWKYFATSHGKGVVDGIGGSAKSLVRTKVMSQSNDSITVQNAEDFYNAVQKLMPGVTTMLITDESIAEFIDSLNPWDNVKEAQGISKMHFVSCADGKNVKLFKTARDEPSIVLSYSDLPPAKPIICIGDWVIVLYDMDKYPGEVTNIVGNNTRVNVMKQLGNVFWAWPPQEDAIYYKPEKVLGKIDPPILVSTGSTTRHVQYKFSAVI